MKTSGISGILILSILFSVACKSSKKEISAQEKLKTEIIETEKVLYSELEVDEKIANEMIDKYISYADNYPDDKLSPEYLFKAADIAMRFHRYEDAISCLDKILTKYKDYCEYPTCIFLKAYIYENYLNDFVKAEECYKKYIAQYPNHKFVKDAEAGLEFLGIDELEMITQFDELNDTIQ